VTQATLCLCLSLDEAALALHTHTLQLTLRGLYLSAYLSISPIQGRKWFDSGEYELSKKNPKGAEPLGVGIPDPGKIPHSVPKHLAGGKAAETKPSSLHTSTESE
jgi:hypothetical protein